MQAINTDIASMATEHGIDVDALEAFMDYEGLDDLEEALEAFQDAYAGTYSSIEAWAEEFLDDTGTLEGIPENLRMYFDYEAWARDARLNGDIWISETDAGTAIFWRR